MIVYDLWYHYCLLVLSLLRYHPAATSLRCFALYGNVSYNLLLKFSPVTQARGRLLLYEVDYAYLAREDGSHEYAVKLRQVYAKEQLGPVAGEVSFSSAPVEPFASRTR